MTVIADYNSILPEHGGITILKKELEEYRVFAPRGHRPDLCGDVLWLKS